MGELRDLLDKFQEIYNDLKNEIRRKDEHLYERWKAGGFLVDPDIMSMYPHIEKVVEDLEDDEEELADVDLSGTSCIFNRSGHHLDGSVCQVLYIYADDGLSIEYMIEFPGIIQIRAMDQELSPINPDD